MTPEPAIFRDAALTPSTLAQRLFALASLEPAPPRGTPVGGRGGEQQTERIATIADWIATSHPGHFAEIGCYAGKTTVALAKVAEKHELEPGVIRRVVAIDPFPAGTEYRLQEEIKPVFLKAMAPWPAIEFWEVAGESDAARELLSSRNFAFVFCDAGKDHEDVRKQIGNAMQRCTGAIAIDDAYSNSVLRAADEMARESEGQWTHLRISSLRETWLVREPGR